MNRPTNPRELLAYLAEHPHLEVTALDGMTRTIESFDGVADGLFWLKDCDGKRHHQEITGQ